MGQVGVTMLAVEAFSGDTSSSSALTSSLTAQASLTTSLALGTAHFYFMEVKPGPYSGSLQVRPYGFLALVSAVVGLGALATSTAAA